MTYEDPVTKALMNDLGRFRKLLARGIPAIGEYVEELNKRGTTIPTEMTAMLGQLYAEVTEYRLKVQVLIRETEGEQLRLALELDRTLRENIELARKLIKFKKPGE